MENKKLSDNKKRSQEELLKNIENANDTEELLKVINNEDDPEKLKIIMRELTVTKTSPLPDATEFSEYEKAVPGAGDRILKMAENEQKHRHEMMKKEQENYHQSNVKLTIFGVISGMMISICGIAGAVLLGWFGQPWTAGLIGSLSLGSIVANILKATSRQSKK